MWPSNVKNTKTNPKQNKTTYLPNTHAHTHTHHNSHAHILSLNNNLDSDSEIWYMYMGTHCVELS